MAETKPTPQVSRQQLAMQAQYLRVMAERLDQRLAALTEVNEEHHQAIQLLENLPTGKAYLPVGAAALVKADLAADRPVLIGLGAGVLVELPRADALAKLKERDEKLHEEIHSTQHQLQDTMKEMESLEELNARLAQGAPGSDAPAKGVKR